MKGPKIQFLNKELAPDKIHTVLFPFQPIAIPIDKSGKICAESDAEGVHYATIVYELKEDRFLVLEFNERIKHILSGYRGRHDRLEDLEILLSRWPDTNKFRINIGNTRKHGLPEKMAANREVFSDIQKDLLNKYLAARIGHEVMDIG